MLMYPLDGLAPQALSDEAIDAWLGEFQILYGGIELVGPAGVREAILGVKQAIDRIGVGAARRKADGEFHRSFAEACRSGRGVLVSAVDSTVDAMRADVALTP